MLKNLSTFLQQAESRRRVLMTVFGVLICGFGVSLCRLAAFGVDSFQTFCTGIYDTFPGVAQGTLYVIINAVLLIAVLIYNRHYVGLGTLINMFLLGYVADGGERLLRAMFPQVTLLGQFVFLIVGLLVLCVSSSLYITADLGVSTYDAVALHLEAKKLGQYRWLRICTDLICVAIGWALSWGLCKQSINWMLAICPIITSLMLGPLTSWFRDHLARPLRYGRKSI